MKKGLWFLLVVVFVVIALLIGALHLNPLRRSSSNIRKKMLKQFPVGTHISDVVQAVESNANWKHLIVQETRGVFIHPETGQITFYGDESFNCIGTQAIRFCLGEYRSVFPCSVLVYMAFDDSGYLVEILINKEYDAP